MSSETAKTIGTIFQEYRQFVAQTALYPSEIGKTITEILPIYSTLGLSNEAAEFSEKCHIITDPELIILPKNRFFVERFGKEYTRRDISYSHDDIVSELGDVLWYLQDCISFSLSGVGKLSYRSCQESVHFVELMVDDFLFIITNNMSRIDQSNRMSLSEAHVDLNVRVGRFSGLVKKVIRGDYDINSDLVVNILLEKFQSCLAGIIHSLVHCAAAIEYHFLEDEVEDRIQVSNLSFGPVELVETLMSANMMKLRSRKERNVLRGDGDNR